MFGDREKRDTDFILVNLSNISTGCINFIVWCLPYKFVSVNKDSSGEFLIKRGRMFCIDVALAVSVTDHWLGIKLSGYFVGFENVFLFDGSFFFFAKINYICN